MTNALILPSFIAGVITFIAPCTLPIIPAFLSFISGVSLKEITQQEVQRKIRFNALMYVLGFSAVFIIFGSLAGFTGQIFVGYQLWLARLGGVFVALFGFFMLSSVFASKLQPLYALQNTILKPVVSRIQPGHWFSSFLFGAVFALGWTPCVGPVLGAVLTLAATTSRVWEGAFLLAIFSLGFSLPFMVIAWSLSSASAYIERVEKYTPYINGFGGIFLVVIGILIAANSFGFWAAIVSHFSSTRYYEWLLPYF